MARRGKVRRSVAGYGLVWFGKDSKIRFGGVRYGLVRRGVMGCGKVC